MSSSDVDAGRPLEPADAIRQIAYLRDLLAATRVRVAAWYPFFFVWGAAWIVGYVCSHVAVTRGPDSLFFAWPGLVVAATVIGSFVGRNIEAPRPEGFARQLSRINLVFTAGFVVLGVVLATTTGLDVGLYAPICVGIMYAVNGVLVGKELVVIGAWLMAASFAATFMPLSFRWLWMAAAGGGGLLVTGFLLRRQNVPG